VGLGGVLLYGFWTSYLGRMDLVQLSEYATIGRDLFRLFVILQLVLVGLASLSAGSERIVRERRSGTLWMLVSTPLKPWDIVLAKWSAATLQSISLILAGVPAIALCVYLGGVGPEDLLWSTSLTIAVAVLAAAFGIRASAFAATAPKALLLAAGYFVGFTLLPLAVVLMGGWPAVFLIPFAHPAYAAGVMLASPDDAYRFSWILATLASFGIARWSLRSAAKILLPRSVRLDTERTPVTPPVLRTAATPARPGGEMSEEDPLFWKDFATRPGARWTALQRWGAVAYFLLFALLVWFFSNGQHLGSFLFLASAPACLALAAGSVLYAPEKEGRRLEMLLASPLSTARLVLTKLAAGVAGPEGLGVLGVLLLLAVAFSWWSGPLGVLIVAGVGVLFPVSLYILAAWASLRSTTVPGALLLSGCIAGAVVLVLPLAVAILAPPGARGAGLPGWLYLLSSINPVWVLEAVTPGSLREAPARFLFFGAAWGSASAALIAWMACRGDRSLGRC
jgi:ABC-type transport system involved in multi-copper enzyme maturation permease subunit